MKDKQQPAQPVTSDNTAATLAALHAEIEALKANSHRAMVTVPAPTGTTELPYVNTTMADLKPAQARPEDPLMAHLRGGRLPSPVPVANRTGVVQNFWLVYIGQGTSFARAGFTGANVAVMLCCFGYIELHCYGKVYAPKTPEALLPTAAELARERATYRFVDKIPTRAEFYEIVREEKATSKRA